jgi:polyphosphate kinase
MTKKTKSRKKDAKANLGSPELYINRELSWLEFNDRVLREGLSESVPPLERLKFLAIVSSNLDEWFMIRVAALKQQHAAGVRQRDPSGLTAGQQLGRLAKRVRQMVAEQSEGIRRVVRLLRDHGLHLLEARELSAGQERFVRSFFQVEVLPVLTPLAIDQLDPSPVVPGLRLMVALRLSGKDAEGAARERIAVVPVPTGLGRFITLPAEQGLHLVRIEEVIALNAGMLFPGNQVEASMLFRITRDADVAVSDDAAEDLLEVIEQAVSERLRRSAIRLTIQAGGDRRLKRWLMDWAGVTAQDVYEVEGMLDPTALMEVATRPGMDDLRDPEWIPQTPRDLLGAGEDLFETIQEHDVLMAPPYESFSPVIQLLEQAADDGGVLAIKQTLYRTSGDSAVIAALERAARNGKQVTVLVELRARFDEARNVGWARRLEDAGALVLYGIAGYKTHAKALLIVRREAQRIRRYVHLATGNYNEKTARLYSDLGLMTCDNEFATDVSAFFNLLTGYSEQVGWSRLAIAPTGLRQRFVELIDREIDSSTPQEPGLIMAKLNSLQDKGMVRALYRASQAGVRVRLNVRGMCCLRPGVPGVSDNIEVRSIVDRYLEHSRIYYFRNAGHEEVYMGSADWMGRNLDRRLEILFPVADARVRRRLIRMLGTYFADNVKARVLLADGSYVPVEHTGKAVRAQEWMHREAVEGVKAFQRANVRFRPLRRPKET